MSKKTVIEQMIGLLRNPIAQRKGINIPADECLIWAGELEKELKSIPERFTLLSEQEWREEDEKNLRRAIRATKVVYPETADWLKSIGNRITWKVSDAQIQALKKACDKHCEPDGLDPLYTLYEELKKLKGE